MTNIIDLLKNLSIEIKNIDISKMSESEKIELAQWIVSITKEIEVLVNKFNKNS